MKTKRVIAICALCLSLTACGGNKNTLPPEPVTGATYGTAAFGLLKNAQITAYAVSEETPHCATGGLRKIGQGSTNERGWFNFTLGLDSGYVLYHLKKGVYTEEASQRNITLTNKQGLKAVSYYQADSPRNLIITPWSHLQAGLFCWMIENEEASIQEAEKDSADFMQEWINFDPRYVEYKDPTDAWNARLDVPIDDGLLLGMLNAALSEWTRAMSRDLEQSEHLSITSASAADVFYEDIYSDGTLDGRGLRSSLYFTGRSFAPRRLSAQTYRLDVPQAMLNFYDESDYNRIRDRNQRSKVYRLANDINENINDLVFQDQGQAPPLDQDAPNVVWLSPVPPILSGEVNISLIADDLTGIASLDVLGKTAKGVILEENQDPLFSDIRKQFLVSLDTSNDGTSDVDYLVRVSDSLGNNQTYAFPVSIINEPPEIRFTSPSRTRSSDYTLAAEIGQKHPKQTINDGVCYWGNASEGSSSFPVDASANTYSCQISLTSEKEYHIQMRLCDRNLPQDTCVLQTHRITFDKTAPAILPVETEDMTHTGNVSLRFHISDSISQLAGLPMWSVTGNGQTLSGEVSSSHRAANEFEVFFDSSRFGSGVINLNIRAQDRAGNEAIHQTSLSVLNMPPEIRLISSARFAGNAYMVLYDIEENSYSNLQIRCRVVDYTPFIAGDYQAGVGSCPLLLPGLPEGPHTLEIRACGNYGLCELGSFPIFKDSRPPTIDLKGFPAIFETADALSLRIGIEDASNISHAVYQVDEEDELPLNPPANISDSFWQFTLDTRQLTTGLHNISFEVKDALDNKYKTSRTFLVLRDEPTITPISAALTKDATYQLNAGIDPKTYGGAYTATCALGRLVVAASITNNILSCYLDINDIPDGEHSVLIALNADYGAREHSALFQRSYARPLTIIKDTSAPIIQPRVHLPLEYTAGPVTLSFTITDALSDVSAMSYQIDDQEALPIAGSGAEREISLPTHSLATGAHTLTLKATDALDHTQIFQYNFLVLRDEPTVMRTSAERTKDAIYPLTAQIDPGSYAGSYTASCEIAGKQFVAMISHNILACQLDIRNIRDGSHQVDITLNADYGVAQYGVDYYHSYERSVTIIKDTEAPEIQPKLPLASQYTTGPVTLSFTITDALSDVSAMSYQIDGQEALPIAGSGTEREISLPTHSLATGAHTLTLKATDALDHIQIFQYNFLVLRDEPRLTRTSSPHTKEAIYPLTAQIDPRSYAGSYTASCEIAGKQFPATISHNILACQLDMQNIRDGSHQVDITLNVDYGVAQYGSNYDRSYARSVTIIKDTEAPEIQPLLPLETQYTTGPITLSFMISDEASSITSAFYQIDADNRVPIAGTGPIRQINLPTHLLATGAHTLTLTVTDELEHKQNFQHHFLVLRDEPTVMRTSAERTKDDAYTLSGRINAGSYTGSYSGNCVFNRQKTPLVIETRGGQIVFSCVLNLQSSPDGELMADIELIPTGYTAKYTRPLTFIKDTAPPVIEINDLAAAYGAEPFELELSVSDIGSPVSSVSYRYTNNDQKDIEEMAERIAPNGNLWRARIDPTDIDSGEITLFFVATDALQQTLERPYSIVVIKEAPRLQFTHPRLVREASMDITGTFSLVFPSAAIEEILCLNPNPDVSLDARAYHTLARLSGNTFICSRYDVDGFNAQDIRVRVCDIHDNCRIAETRVTQDATAPISASTAIIPRVSQGYDLAHADCLVDGESAQSNPRHLNRLPVECPLKEEPTILGSYYDFYDVNGPDYASRITEPSLTLISQKAANLNPTARIDREDLENRSLAFVAIDVEDPSAASGDYYTPADLLEIKYSYYQWDCDSSRANDRRCSAGNKHIIFEDKEVPAVYRNEETREAEITIPFTNQFLNHPGKPLWYLAKPRVIHIIRLSVCDEAGNCLEREAVFRIKVLGEQPELIVSPVPLSTEDQLIDKDNFLFNSRSPIETRRFIISNPTELPIWFAPAEEQQNTEVEIRIHHSRRQNAWDWRAHHLKTSRRAHDRSDGDNSRGVTRYTGISEAVWGDFRGETHIIYTDEIPWRNELPPRYVSYPAGSTLSFYPGGRGPHAGRSYTGVAKQQKPGYPIAADAGYARSQIVEMEAFDVLDGLNAPYVKGRYIRLMPGETQVIRYRERVPSRSSYFHTSALRMPPSYSGRLEYDHSARTTLNGKFAIKYTREINNRPDPSAEQLFEYDLSGNDHTFATPLK